MPPPPISPEKMKQAIEALQAALDAGYRYNGIPSAFQKAAQSIGLDHGTLRHRVYKAQKAGFTVKIPDAEPEPVPEIERLAKPRIRVQATSSSDAPVYRVLGIGDAHDNPGLPDKSRFKWIARHAVATKPDYIVQIGDFADFNSLSRHDAPGSLPQKLRPSYANDMASLEEALAAIHKEAAGMRLHVTLGNHERRVYRFEQGTAEIEGSLWQPLLDLFARYGWRTHDEGEFLFIGGVGFVHCPRTLMNREYGGKTLNAIANDAVFSLVFGHSHRGQLIHAPKIGPVQSVSICNLGTCLPTGYVAEYAKVAMTGWSYSIWDLTLQGGRITGHRVISMDELERMYGD